MGKILRLNTNALFKKYQNKVGALSLLTNTVAAARASLVIFSPASIRAISSIFSEGDSFIRFVVVMLFVVFFLITFYRRGPQPS